jgi:hypothetical protein
LVGQKFLLWRLKKSEDAKNEAATDSKADEVTQIDDEGAAAGPTVDDDVQKAEQKAARMAKEFTAEEIAMAAAEAMKGVATDYAVDEVAELRFQQDPDVWVECKIVGHSDLAYQYKVEIDSGACQDAYLYEGQTLDVSVRSLRKLEACEGEGVAKSEAAKKKE